MVELGQSVRASVQVSAQSHEDVAVEFPAAIRAVAPVRIKGAIVRVAFIVHGDRGIELRIVADKGMSVDGYDYKALVVRKDLVDSGAFKSLADLKGKKAGVTNYGTSSDIATRVSLKQLGLDADKDLTVVEVGNGSNVRAALEGGA